MDEKARKDIVRVGPNQSRALSSSEFHRLADVPAAAIWLANIDNANTRRAYESDVGEFVAFVGIEHPDEFREVARAHIIAFRGVLESRELAPATVRRKLAAISSLFDHLCNENAVPHNPVSGVKRPAADNNEGKTPALSDDQARELLNAPEGGFDQSDAGSGDFVSVSVSCAQEDGAGGSAGWGSH